MTQDLAKTVASFYEYMAHRDYPALVDMMDSQVEWSSAENFLYAEDNPYHGIEKVTGILRQIDADWQTFTIMTLETMVASDTAIVRGRYRGKLKEGGFALDAEFVHVLRFRHGKLVRGQSYTDTAQFRDAVNRLKRSEQTDTQTGL